ncbi:MAG: hypothetical protein J1F41_11725, partial [Lachnospiraceae bacterium]|nr:hypothetical protein [Lachnospiraceae bacterium]
LELDDEEIRTYFDLYNWNCLFIGEDIPSIDFNIKFNFIMKDNLNYYTDYLSTLFQQLYDCVGYYPPCIIIVTGMATARLNRIIYHYGFTKMSKSWLKQTSIEYYKSKDVNFTFFGVDRIIMRILNPLIKPDTSRKFIVNSSEKVLQRAIDICILLWIYDQIKTDKEAVISIEYIKQLILEEWDDSVEGLLKPEKKPI